MPDSIKKVVILGSSGTIGSLTGGLLAQNNLDVWFLSRTIDGAHEGLRRAQAQARSEVIKNRITCGEYGSMLEQACGEADWILECVSEDSNTKKQMYEKIDAYRDINSVVSSVTSSLVLEDLPKGRSDSFQEHFLSTHFYNPPGKMLACEISGQSRTDPSVVRFMTRFLERRLRRVVIPVKPSAAFAGNRIAFLLLARITQMVIDHGVEMMDYLIGPYTGRTMTPLATIDLVGLDIHKAIIRSLQRNTDDSMKDRLCVPEYVETMIQTGRLGRKSRDKSGFYKRLENGQYAFFDPDTCSYVPAFKPHVQFVEKANSLIHVGLYSDAFQVLAKAHGPEAEIVREIIATYISYAYSLVGEVTNEEDGITGIDRVMTAGFNWAAPSTIVNVLGGKDKAIELIESAEMVVPEALSQDRCDQPECSNAGRYFHAR